MAKSGKKALSNFIRHAHSHNKVQEERMMWQQRELELTRDHNDSSWRPHPLVSGRLVSDEGTSGRRYDSLDSVLTQSESDSHSAQYWTRQLMKVEENDPFRWGHSGYKEQNPDEFVSSDDNEGSNERLKGEVRQRPKKRKHSKRDRSTDSPSRTRKNKHRDVTENSDSEDEIIVKKKHTKSHNKYLKQSEGGSRKPKTSDLCHHSSSSDTTKSKRRNSSKINPKGRAKSSKKTKRHRIRL